jgi:hypothetical protein
MQAAVAGEWGELNVHGGKRFLPGKDVIIALFIF